MKKYGDCKYRVVMVRLYRRIDYLVQKRGLFGIWYNPFYWDGIEAGCFGTEEEAIEAIRSDYFGVDKQVVAYFDKNDIFEKL